MKRIVLTFFLFILMLNSLSGQQSNWISTLFVEPTPSPYLSDWQNNPMLGRFTLTYNGLSPTSFIFAVKITSPQYGELVAARSSQIDWPAGPYTQVYTPYDVLSWNDVKGLTFNNAMKERIVRSGRFPEGEFTLEILVKSMQGAVLNASTADFSIIYPEPPQLILPQDLEVVTMPQPFFQWSLVNAPITMPITYKIKIVERLEGQNINQALLANPIHHVDSVVGIGLYNYPMQGFPFINGKEYVWQISATDQEGNVVTSNYGKSEIWSFYYGTPPSSQTPTPDTVTIVQNVAYLINMRSINVTPIIMPGQENGFTFNGSPTLVLNIDGEERAFNVTVSNLTVSIVHNNVMPFGPLALKIESGSISANMNPGIPIGDYFKATDLSYNIMDGLSIGGALSLPGIQNIIPLNGRLTVNQFGLSGNLSVERPSNNPLIALGEGIAKFLITKADIHFSEPEIKLGGVLQLFGMNTDCNIQDLSLGIGGTINSNITCNLNTAIPLVPNSDRLELTFNNITGNISANLSSGAFTYDLQTGAGLNFKTTAASSYGADLQVAISNSQASSGAINVISFTPRGIANPPAIDLGWIQLAMSNLSLAQLAFADGSWNFSMGMNLTIIIPAFGNLSLPELQGATLGANGLTIPALNLASLNLPPFNLQALRFEMLRAEMPSVTIPFFSGGVAATTGLNFTFDFRMRMANIAGGALANHIFDITNATFSNGVFNANISSLNFNEPGIALSCGTDITYNLRELSGSISADFSSGTPVFNPTLRIRGNLNILSGAFTFSGGSPLINLMGTSLSLDGNGKIMGTIESFNPGCSIEFPYFNITFQNISMLFDNSGEKQRIIFDGEVICRRPNPAGSVLEGNGTINYELTTSTINSLKVEINNPFIFNIPSVNPLFSFSIPKARITQNALLLDGRAALNLGGGLNVGTTFRNMKISHQSNTIVSGDVIFDFPFALKVILDNNNLQYIAVPANSNFNDPTGIMLNLPNSISLGANGFVAQGSSNVKMRFQGRPIESIVANFANDFAISMQPLKVTAGKVEFFIQNTRIATLSSEGFSPNMTYFASQMLPEKIPLPTESIGYLKIKQGNDYLIDYESVATGIRIKTKPGQPIKMFMPILRLNRPAIPELDVEFDVILNPENWQFIQGNINVSVPPDKIAAFDLSQAGVPFKISSLTYGDLAKGTGFQLTGNIKAFGNSLGNSTNLFVFKEGRLEGEVDLALNQSIPLVANSDKLNLSISQITTTFNLQLSPLNLNYDILLSGGIKLNLGSNKTYGANADFKLNRNGISVENFVVDTPIEAPKLDFSWVTLSLKNFALPSLSYSSANGWNFEIRVEASIGFSEIGYQLPTVNGIIIRKTGILIPQISMPEINANYSSVLGFNIKPLAFRMQAFNINWFGSVNIPTDWGFIFDFELAFSGMPNSVPENIRNVKLRALNSTFKNGKITGNIQSQNFNAPGLSLPLGGATNFLIKQISGKLSVTNNIQNFNISLNGDIQLPEFMRCGGSNGISPVAATTLVIDSKGKITGSTNNFVPPCPINLGIGKFVITGSNIIFELGGEDQKVSISAVGNLKLPAPTAGDSISANGQLKFDLLSGELIDGQILIDYPFRWQIPNENPALKFTINNATFNKNGLTMTGRGKLNLNAARFVFVDFENLLLNHKTLRIESGTATFQNQFALKLILQSGQINWSAVDLESTITENNAVKLTLPQNLTLSANGISASGETSVLVKFNGTEFDNLRCIFSNDFSLQYSPFKVRKGEARITMGQTLAGVLDKDGFHPGDILGMLPIPAKLPLPDTTIAYLVLKQGNNLLVNTEVTPQGIRISSKPNQTVKLVLPGLRFGGDPPELNITFNIVVNTSTFELKTGSISVTPSGNSDFVLNLQSLGIPIKITRLLFGKIGLQNESKLMVGVKLILPDAIAQAAIRADSLIVSSHGIEGIISAGNYSPNFIPNSTYISTVNIGNYGQFKFNGFRATLQGGTKNIRMSGDITVDIFRENSGTQIPIHWYAVWENGFFNFSLNVTHVPDLKLPVLMAFFKPQAIGQNPAFSLDLSGNFPSLTLSGVLSFPTISQGLRISFSGLRISNNGVTVPEVSISSAGAYQLFNLYGASFTLKNLSANEKAISFAYTNRVFYLTLNGELRFFENTTQFRGLKFGSNGTVSLNQLNLLSAPFWIVQNYIGISRISIGGSGMTAVGFVKLPQPADTSRRIFELSINTSGQISGGTNIELINENPGIGGGDNTEWNFWLAKYDVTYAKISLNLANFRQSTLEVNSDIYFLNNPNKYIRIGYKQGGTNRPGFRITFNGNMQWGNIQVANNLANINWEALKLNITNAGINNPGNGPLSLNISGNLGVNLPGVSGSLNFNGLRISTSGILQNLGQAIQGGSLSIAEVVDVTINNLSYLPGPTYKWIKEGHVPGTGVGNSVWVDSFRVEVTNYFSFGASVSIAGVASGGVDELLIYNADNATQLTIKNANLNIPNVVRFRADLVYSRLGNNFYILLGGKGKLIDQYEVGVIGKVARRNGQSSFGAFVYAGGLNITIPPAIVLTSLGGGFFYNPDPADLQAVREMCALDNNTQGRIVANPGRFAVLIFAEAAIINRNLIRGRVLLTLTQNFFELRGEVTLLDQGNRFKGLVYLNVGFANQSAVGNISINVSYSPLFTGNASLGFYVFRNNIWGVDGNINLRILNIVTCNSTLFIGNPGFYVSMSVGVKIDVWIFDVRAGMGLQLWYIKANSQWGAYGHAYIRIEVCDITFASIGFAAAWIRNVMIYGEASFDVLWWTETVWGAIEDGRTRGGWGGNSDYRRRINAALTDANNMKNQRNSAINQLNNYR